MSHSLIDTPTALVAFLESLPDCKGELPDLFVDLEGSDLSRHGTLSLITILVRPRNEISMVDVTTLGRAAFETSALDGRTLRTVFETKDIKKVFFDIRNDSDALFGLFGISLDGIEDLQLMELASRNFSRRCVNGLAKCIEQDAALDLSEKRRWATIKEQGRKLFNPTDGGSFAVFDRRPLSTEIMKYCTQDVLYMPNLHQIYQAKLCDAWWIKIADETSNRIRQSHAPDFNGKGRHMAMGPVGWATWRPSSYARNLPRFSPPVPSVPDPIPASHSPRHEPRREKHDELITAIQKMRLEAIGGKQDLSHTDRGYDSHDDERDFGDDLHDERDEPRDLTACDKECGYCGTCPY